MEITAREAIDYLANSAYWTMPRVEENRKEKPTKQKKLSKAKVARSFKRLPVKVKQKTTKAAKQTNMKAAKRATVKATKRKQVATTTPTPTAPSMVLENIETLEVSIVSDALKALVQSEEAIELVLVLDSSGSMSGERFEKQRECCKLICSAFEARKPTIGIIQFGTHSKIELDMTNDLSKVTTVASSLPFMSSSTTLPLPAFVDARKLLEGDRGCKKLLIFFTDGGGFNKDVEDASKKLQQEENVIVIILGVGVSDSCIKNISHCATDSHGYHVHNFDQLLRLFTDRF